MQLDKMILVEFENFDAKIHSILTSKFVKIFRFDWAKLLKCLLVIEEEMEDTLRFEIWLAEISTPKELRRNESELYNPVILSEMESANGNIKNPIFLQDFHVFLQICLRSTTIMAWLHWYNHQWWTAKKDHFWTKGQGDMSF